MSENAVMNEQERAEERAAAVVVEVDGSEGATAALRWAFAEARLRQAPLRHAEP